MSTEAISVLFLRLEGPLQSWGDDSKWTVRRSRPEPSKSGVIGLLAAAMGLGLDERCDREVASLGRSLGMAVRADRQGRIITDFHTICGGSLTASGKDLDRIKKTEATGKVETILSWRDYIADACFLVALSGPPGTLGRLEHQLADPVWTPFLGRKSCPPSAPIWPALPERGSVEEHESLETALQSFQWIGGRDKSERRPEYAKAILEVKEGSERQQAPIYTRWDVPISFSKRLFSSRLVYQRLMPLPKEV